jgi:uncharacterized membrane protein
MTQWLYKWLPIICGCHCRPDRSFHFRGKPFPVCARCTGFLAGFILSAITYAFWHPASVILLILMLLPMITDGILQARTAYESTNLRRVISGFCFGYAILTLFLMMIIFFYHVGFDIGLKLKN